MTVALVNPLNEESISVGDRLYSLVCSHLDTRSSDEKLKEIANKAQISQFLDVSMLSPAHRIEFSSCFLDIRVPLMDLMIRDDFKYVDDYVKFVEKIADFVAFDEI